MSRADRDGEMSELSGRRCSDSALLVNRTHIIVSVVIALLGSVVLGVVVENLVVAMLAALLFVNAVSLLADRRVLAMADGGVVHAKCAPFRRKPTLLLSPLTLDDLEDRSTRSSKNFVLRIHDSIFIGQRGSGEFARALRSKQTREL